MYEVYKVIYFQVKLIHQNLLKWFDITKKKKKEKTLQTQNPFNKMSLTGWGTAFGKQFTLERTDAKEEENTGSQTR